MFESAGWKNVDQAEIDIYGGDRPLLAAEEDKSAIKRNHCVAQSSRVTALKVAVQNTAQSSFCTRIETLLRRIRLQCSFNA